VFWVVTTALVPLLASLAVCHVSDICNALKANNRCCAMSVDITCSDLEARYWIYPVYE